VLDSEQVRKRRTCSQVGSKLKNVVVVVVLFGVGLSVFLSVDCHRVNTPVEDSSIRLFLSCSYRLQFLQQKKKKK
jgi:hypothetical protein